MFNLTIDQLATIKRQAIEELLTTAKLNNIHHNSTVVSLGLEAKAVPFTSIPLTEVNDYLQTLYYSDDHHD